jgi:phytoene synthase
MDDAVDPDLVDPRLASAYAHCEAQVRAFDRDRWLACLFAPSAKRPHLHALYAFSLDIARIREIVSDPRPGEIRYQWWREALEGAPRGDISAHPVANAILDTVNKFRLSRTALTNLVDARTFDLYDDPMPGLRQLEGYCGETCSALFRLAAQILANGRDAGGVDAVGHAGVAFAMTGLLRALPWHAARGQVYLPTDVLSRHGISRDTLTSGKASPGLASALAEMRAIAREHLTTAIAKRSELKPEARPSLLPLAICEPYLKQMETSAYDPFRTLVELPQWRVQWALWRAARNS